MTQSVKIIEVPHCKCGHSLVCHSHGPGRPVSCGRARCDCRKWEEAVTKFVIEAP